MGDRICEDCGLPVVICIAKDMVNEAAKQHGRAAVLSALDAAEARDVGVRVGWVIGNGSGDKWRCAYDPFTNSEWVSDRSKALKFATREDAESYSEHDEDAWLIQEVALHPASPLGAVVMRAKAADKLSENWGCTIQKFQITGKLFPGGMEMVRGKNGETEFFSKTEIDRRCAEKIAEIRALPLPTDDELLAAAAERPEVRALVEKSDRIANWTIGSLLADHQENREKYPLLSEAIVGLRAALAPFTRKGE